MRRIKKGLTLLAVIVAMGAVQACGESPTGPSGDEGSKDCVWLNGQMHCSS